MDTVRMFIDGIIKEDDKITARKLYTAYTDYCKNTGEGYETQNTFGSRLGSLYPQLSKSKNGNGNMVWNVIDINSQTQ